MTHNRPLEIDDLPIVADFATALTKIPGFDWASCQHVRKESEENPSYVFGAEAVLRTDPSRAIANNLPSPDFDETSLLGRREELKEVKRALRGSWPLSPSWGMAE